MSRLPPVAPLLGKIVTTKLLFLAGSAQHDAILVVCAVFAGATGTT